MGRTRLVVPTPGSRDIHRPSTVGVADQLRRLMPRDLWLLDLLADHQTLTTGQVTALAFPTPAKAYRRLRLLHDRGVLDRFRYAVRPGSQAWRWTLAPTGAALVAARRGQPIPRPAAVRARTDRIATSPRLDHLLGVNEVFCELAAHARHHPGTLLAAWWSEQRATRATGGLAHPDGGGVWQSGRRRVAFWLEYDTGTEPLPRLVDKLTGYARLATTDLARPVLFWLPNPAREEHLRAQLRRTDTPVTVATTNPDYADGHGGPAGPVWHVEGHPGRCSLAEITGPTATADASNVEGDPWAG